MVELLTVSDDLTYRPRARPETVDDGHPKTCSLSGKDTESKEQNYP